MALDGIEKADEFLVPVALHAAADDLAVGPGLTTFSVTQVYTLVVGGANASYGGGMQLTAVVPEAPEPASFALLVTGLLRLDLVRRRRRA